MITIENDDPEFRVKKTAARLIEEEAESKIRAGRPPHSPSDQNRSLVTIMAGCGIERIKIADVLNISIATLGHHYTHELENGKTVLDGQVLAAFFKNIQAGKERSIIYYLASRIEGFAAPQAGLFGKNNGSEYKQIESTPQTIAQAKALYDSVRK